MKERYSTRHYSSLQEKDVAKKLSGKTVSNSGATAFLKGDVKAGNFLVECKTATSAKKSMSIQKEWLDKIKEEAFSQGCTHHALIFNFGQTSSKVENYAIIPEKEFIEYKNLLEELENE